MPTTTHSTTTERAAPAATQRSESQAARKAAEYGMHSVTPHLTCRNAAQAIAFYEQAFDASPMIVLPGPDGKIMHACLSINGSSVMLVDENLAHGLRSPQSFEGTPPFFWKS